jgi:hypothetical protein
MASKYYNPRLASSVAAAKQAGFFDAGKGVAEGFKASFEGAAPYLMGALKEYQEDVEKIYDINFDSNGIALDKIEDLTSFVKQERENAFQARQKGILPGKEATGEAMLNVQGASKVAKYHGGVTQQIQEFLQDPDQVSEANEIGALPMLSSIVNAKIDYNDKDSKFFALGDGTKLSMKDLENELGNLIVVPDEAYNEFFDFAEAITPKKESYEGSTYYTFDEMDTNKIKTKAYSLIDKYGKDFVWDALSNSSPFRGVTVADFIDPKLNLQTKSKSDMEKIIANVYGLDNKQAVFDKAQQLVADGYTEAAKNMYPTRPKVVKPEEATQREKDEQIVKQDVFKAAEILKTKDFNPTISKIGSLSETRNIQDPESYKAQINKLSEELKDLGLGASVEYKKDEEGEDTNILEGFVIYPTRTVLRNQKTEQIINTSQTPNQIKKAILDALGRSYGTLNLSYDQLINTENSLPKF